MNQLKDKIMENGKAYFVDLEPNKGKTGLKQTIAVYDNELSARDFQNEIDKVLSIVMPPALYSEGERWRTNVHSMNVQSATKEESEN